MYFQIQAQVDILFIDGERYDGVVGPDDVTVTVDSQISFRPDSWTTPDSVGWKICAEEDATAVFRVGRLQELVIEPERPSQIAGPLDGSSSAGKLMVKRSAARVPTFTRPLS